MVPPLDKEAGIVFVNPSVDVNGTNSLVEGADKSLGAALKIWYRSYLHLLFSYTTLVETSFRQGVLELCIQSPSNERSLLGEIDYGGGASQK